MNELDNVIRYNKLLSCYQNLLTGTQKDILINYFEYNLSLSEIAIERNISRSAVEDALKKGMKKLDDIENSCHFLDTKEKLLTIVNDKKKDSKTKLDEIERNLKDGI